jgi:rfaE bifunctional protein kinase chain/domain
LLTPNRSELRQVVGGWRDDAELQQKASRLRSELKLDALLVTRSEEGMTLFTAAAMEHVPAVAREVYDVSGAGDTVIATLAVMLGGGLSLPQAMRQANLAAGIVVGKLGTATCSLEELKQLN